MDKTQIVVKNKLGLNNMQVEGFKTIYDFICKFAGVQQATWNQNIFLYDLDQVKILDKHGHIQDIPPKTYQIILSIGTDKLFTYFSPMAYLKHFEGFCKRLLEAKPIHFSDYVVNGLVTFQEKQSSDGGVVEEVISEDDDGLFGLRDAG